jgi:hypothetical protein
MYDNIKLLEKTVKCAGDQRQESRTAHLQRAHYVEMRRDVDGGMLCCVADGKEDRSYKKAKNAFATSRPVIDVVKVL